MSNEESNRFYTPVHRRKLIDIYRSMRNHFEKAAAAKGESLDPSWYEDGPEQMPQPNEEQAHRLPKSNDCHHPRARGPLN